MSDCFVSYSRRDKAFAQQVVAILATERIDCWLDTEDIPPAVNFLDEIFPAIASADAVLYLISPDSVASPYCDQEIVYALSLNKKIIPILCREVSAATLKPQIAPLNWVDFVNQPFDVASALLLSAIRTDQDVARAHRRFLTRALQWDTRQRSSSFLLRGEDLTDAEAWLFGSVGKQPQPTPMHTAYIKASRIATTTRQRIIVASVTVAAMVAAVLALIAFTQRNIALEREALARSRQLAAQSGTELTLGKLDFANLLAVAGYRRAATHESYESLLNATTAQPLLGLWLSADDPSAAEVLYYADVAFAKETNQLLAVACLKAEMNAPSVCAQSEIRVWDLNTGRFIRRDPLPIPTVRVAFNQAASHLALGGADGQLVLYQIATKQVSPAVQATTGSIALRALGFSADGLHLGSGDAEGTVKVWRVETSTNTLAVEHTRVALLNQAVESLVFGLTAETLIVGGSKGDLARWRIGSADSEPVAVRASHTGIVATVAFSAEGMIATGGYDGQVKLWRKQGADLALVAEFAGNGGAGGDHVVDLRFSPDGRMLAVAGEENAALTLWDITKAPPVLLVKPLQVRASRMVRLAFSSNGGQVAAASFDVNVPVWDLKSIQPYFAQPAPSTLSALRGDQLLTTYCTEYDTAETTLCLRSAFVVSDLQTGVVLRSASLAHTSEITAAALLSEDRALTAGCASRDADGVCTKAELRCWGTCDAAFNDQIAALTATMPGITSMVEDGSGVLVGSEDGVIQRLNATTGTKPITTLAASVLSMCSEGGISAAGSSDSGDLAIWRGDQVLIKVAVDSAVFALVCSAKGDYVAAGLADGRLLLWDLTTTAPTAITLAGGLNITALAELSAPDPAVGNLLAVARGTQIELWDMTRRTRLGNLWQGQQGVITGLGTATTSTGRLWQIDDRLARAVQIDAVSLRQMACRLAGRGFSAAEQVRYALEAFDQEPCAP